MEIPLLSKGGHLDHGLVTLAGEHNEGPIACKLIFHRITDETLGVHEGKVRETVSVALVIGDNFNTIIPPDTKAMHSHV